MEGQTDLFDLLEPDPPSPLPRLTGFTMSVTDPDELDSIAREWVAAYAGRTYPDWQRFIGWKDTQTGENARAGAHHSYVYGADLRCHHWARETVTSYQLGYCQCVGRDGMLYRIYCAGCGWWTDVANGENEAAEMFLDHCWPGWRDLPVVETSMKPNGGYKFDLPDDYPADWQVPGAPVRDCRGPDSRATRHVPSGSPWGGYKAAVIQPCKKHERKY